MEGSRFESEFEADAEESFFDPKFDFDLKKEPDFDKTDFQDRNLEFDYNLNSEGFLADFSFGKNPAPNDQSKTDKSNKSRWFDGMFTGDHRYSFNLNKNGGANSKSTGNRNRAEQIINERQRRRLVKNRIIDLTKALDRDALGRSHLSTSLAINQSIGEISLQLDPISLKKANYRLIKAVLVLEAALIDEDLKQIKRTEVSQLICRSRRYLNNWISVNSELYARMVKIVNANHPDGSFPEETYLILGDIKNQRQLNEKARLEQNCLKRAPTGIVASISLFKAAKKDEDLNGLSYREICRFLRVNERYVASWKFRNKELFEQVCQTLETEYKDKPFPEQTKQMLDQIKSEKGLAGEFGCLNKAPAGIVQGIGLLNAIEGDQEINPVGYVEVSRLLGHSPVYMSSWKYNNKGLFNEIQTASQKEQSLGILPEEVQFLLDEVRIVQQGLLNRSCLEKVPDNIIKGVTLVIASELNPDVEQIYFNQASRLLGNHDYYISNWKTRHLDLFEQAYQELEARYQNQPIPDEIQTFLDEVIYQSVAV